MTNPASISTLKVAFGDELRRFAFQPAWKFLPALQQFLSNVLQVPPTSAWSLKYLDDEGDAITVLSQDELDLAYTFADSKGVMRFSVVAAAPTPAPVAPVSSPVSLVPSPSPSPNANVPLWRLRRDQWKAEKALYKEAKKRGENPLPPPSMLENKYQWKLAKAQWRQQNPSPVLLAREPKWAMARFVGHVTLPDGCFVSPGETLRKVWRLRNDSRSFVWPAGCCLLAVGHERMFAKVSIVVSHQVPPGCEVDVVADGLVAPTAPGEYTTFWRMALPDGLEKFGQRIRFQFQVQEKPDESSSSTSSFEEVGTTPSAPPVDSIGDKAGPYAAQLTELHSMGFTDDQLNVKLLTKWNGNLVRVVNKLLRKRDNRERKAALKA